MYSNSAMLDGTRASDSKTVAAFAPSALGHPSVYKRATILVDKKSPLLIATPPGVVRALSYAYPYVSAANKLVALISWTSGDSYASFLLLAFFWAIVLYSDLIIRWTGPLLVVSGLIIGMYLRRYSPLSTKGTGSTASHLRHERSFEDILSTIELFTNRCTILLDPFIRLTDFLSTQRTATSASTRPALTALLIRILFITPVWIILSLPQVSVITTQRTVLVVGTIILSWHSRPARISRILLWRSRLVRRVASLLTGLEFTGSGVREPGGKSLKKKRDAKDIALSILEKRHPDGLKPGVSFTFTVYQNQRRWLGFGWTSGMLPSERKPWTSDLLEPASSTEDYVLPEVAGGQACWRWIDSDWWVDTTTGMGRKDSANLKSAGEGWIYYDTYWQYPRHADGWDRYTRRRKWCRNAELVELTDKKMDSETEDGGSSAEQSNRSLPSQAEPGSKTAEPSNQASDFLQVRTSKSAGKNIEGVDGGSHVVKRNWFGRKKTSSYSLRSSGILAPSSLHSCDDSISIGSTLSKDGPAPSWTTSISTASSAAAYEDDKYSPQPPKINYEQLGLADDLSMGLG